tara:strand:+ start:165 stop:428 length:264 start_codon:yes stop_codon:yes gene_type:complete
MLRFFFDFIERLRKSYPSVYGGGTSEGGDALNYFNKWGFYASLYELGEGKHFEIKRLGGENIHELHVTLSIRNDTNNLKHKIQTKKQ